MRAQGLALETRLVAADSADDIEAVLQRVQNFVSVGWESEDGTLEGPRAALTPAAGSDGIDETALGRGGGLELRVILVHHFAEIVAVFRCKNDGLAELLMTAGVPG